MVSDMLSQDEIDALLKQGNSETDVEADLLKEQEAEIQSRGELEQQSEQENIDDYISVIEQDALGEIGNITFGSASTAFSTLLNQKVDITTPTISLIEKNKLKDEFPKPHVAIHVNYTEGFEGINLLVIKSDDAKVIADLMLGGDGKSPDEELNEMHLSAVQEAMNQMMGSASTSMSTIFNKRVDISPPGIDIVDFTANDENLLLNIADPLIKVSFRMKIGSLIDSSIMQLLPIPFAKEMVKLLLNQGANQMEEEDVKEMEQQPTPVQMNELHHQQHAVTQAPVENPPEEQSGMSQQADGQYQQNLGFRQPVENPFSQMVDARSVNVQPVQFSNFEQSSIADVDTKNLNLLLDIPLQVTVELGRTKKVIKDILELSPGSILELDKLAGEPVDILVNNKLIAKGEVVVIEENFGVRVTDILSQWERLQKLQ